MLGKAVGVMGETFSYLGNDYSGVINEGEAKDDPEVGGNRFGYAMSIYTMKAGFPLPVLGNKLTARGRLLRIIGIAADAISYRLTLEDPNR